MTFLLRAILCLLQPCARATAYGSHHSAAVFVNKVFLECSHAPLLTYLLWLLSHRSVDDLRWHPVAYKAYDVHYLALCGRKYVQTPEAIKHVVVTLIMTVKCSSPTRFCSQINGICKWTHVSGVAPGIRAAAPQVLVKVPPPIPVYSLPPEQRRWALSWFEISTSRKRNR